MAQEFWHEDFETLDGCSKEQLAWIEEHNRQAEAGVLTSRLRRRFLTMFAVPETRPDKLKGYPGLKSSPFDPACPIIDHRIVNIVTFADQPVWRTMNGEIETTVMLQVGYLDASGNPCIGGSQQHHRQEVNFSLEPRFPKQGVEIKLTDRKNLLATRKGVIELRRNGDYLDICVGRLPTLPRPVVLYRLHTRLFYGEDPEAELANGLKMPAEGHALEFGQATDGQLLVTLNKEVSYLSFRLSAVEKHPKHPSNRMSAIDSEMLNTLNTINHEQTSYAMQGTDLPPLQDAKVWAPRAMANFSYQVVDRLLCDQSCGYEAPPALKADFHAAVGPDCPTADRFCHRARIEGELSTAGPYLLPGQPHLVEIATTAGDRQILPATSVLYKYLPDNSAKGLEKGDSLTVGETIGDCCPRQRYDWGELVDHLSINLLGLLREFLLQSAVYPGEHGWEGDGILLDLRYVSQILHLADRDNLGDPLWFWDFRRCSANYFVGGKVLCPPMRYRDWQQDTVMFNGITVKLSDPVNGVPVWSPPTSGKPQAKPTKKAGKKQPKHPEQVATVPAVVAEEVTIPALEVIPEELLRWVETV